MGPTTKELHIHLSADRHVPAGEIHLLAAYADYAELEEFFSCHFDTLAYTHDELGFPNQLYRCPKGSMFIRGANGEIGGPA